MIQIQDILTEAERTTLGEKGYIPPFDVVGEGNTRHVLGCVYKSGDFPKGESATHSI